MKESMRMRFRYYLNRFLDTSVPFKQKWVSGWRYIGMAFGLVIEKLRGVDYEMIYQEDCGAEHCGDYTMSPRKVLERLFNDVNDIENKGFIDIGCGKGYAVKMAYRAGFCKVGGVEYNKYLYDICISNLNIDKVPSDLVYCGMAQEYEGYEQFDVFYFNNPFQADILSEVLKRINNTHRDKECRCYYLNPNDKSKIDAFVENGFKLVKIIEDPAESYFHMNVYVNDI